MQFNTDLPYGRKAIQYTETRGESRLAPNVSAEADAAFIADLERTDPSRHARLMKAQGKRKFGEARWAVGKCSACQGQILDAPFVRDGVHFCSRACRDGSVRPSETAKTFARRKCQGCEKLFESRRQNHIVCSPRCQRKALRKKSSMSDFGSPAPSEQTTSGSDTPVLA